MISIDSKIIAPGQVFIEGKYCLHQFLINIHSRPDESVLFQESIVNLFVQHTVAEGGIIISNDEKCDIINFVQATGMSSLQITI